MLKLILGDCYFYICVIFTALHCMQRGLSDERLSVSCLSVCLSDKRVNCDKTKGPSEKS